MDRSHLARRASSASSGAEEARRKRGGGAVGPTNGAQRFSLRDVLGSDEATMRVAEYLGRVTLEWAPALALARLVPGLSIAGRRAPGPAGAMLLSVDTGLRRLALRRGKGWAHLFDALKVNTGLIKIDLKWCDLEPDDVERLAVALEGNRHLRELELEAADARGVGGPALARLVASNPTLRRLDLFQAKLDGPGGCALGEALAVNTGLRFLVLEGTRLTQAGGFAMAKALLVNRTLRTIRVGSNSVGRAGLPLCRALLTNSTLTRVSLPRGLLKHCGVVLADVVLSNVSLEELEVSDTKFRVRETVNLCDDDSGEDSDDASAKEGGDESSWSHLLAALAKNRALHTLRFPGSSLTEKDGLALARSLAQRPGFLVRLDVSWIPLGDTASAALVAACLKPGSTLRNLDMRRNRMGFKAGLEFARALTTNKSLASLNIAENTMGGVFFVDGGGYRHGESSWELIFAALHQNKGLLSLCLEQCGLSSLDIGALAAAIKANRHLLSLSLYSHENNRHPYANDVGDEGGVKLASAVKTNTALRVLSLAANDLGPAAGLAFADALRSNGILDVLDLANNNEMGAEADAALESAAAQHDTRLAMTYTCLQ